MTNQDFSGVGGDLYVGSPDAAQPDWRDGDPDDEIDDNDDPTPIDRQLLNEMLGIDVDDLDDEIDDDGDIEDDADDLDDEIDEDEDEDEDDEPTPE